MIFAYGNYRHPVSEAGVTIRRRIQASASGTWSIGRDEWTIDAVIQGDTQAALTANLQALEAAYSIPNQNAILYLDDGVTKTAHQLYAQYYFYVLPTLPSYPKFEGGEYSTYRTVQIQLIAEGLPFGQSIGGAGNSLVEFTESIEFWGGGQLRGYVPSLTGRPQLQVRRQQTTYKAIQQGTAMGVGGYPTSLAIPMWPDAIVDPDQLRVRKEAPQRQGFGSFSSYTLYPITWNYFFESADPIFGSATPRVWK